jgi:hypothetical protein
MIDVGSVLRDRYQLNARVGVGGMATVYDGQDLRLQRRVAVKIPLPVYAADPSFIKRFENEAHAAAALTHPNLVAVYDVGEADGAPFIVMEYVDGGTLKDLLREAAPLPPAGLIQIGTQVADALDTAHRHGVVHRDVKPQNILLTPDGRVKLTDFGIALALGAESATRTGTLLGSVQYVAPELVRGESATPLSDVYALGVVLYEIATGHLPFTGDTPMAIAMQHLDADPRRPTAWNPDLPPALEAIVLRAMAKLSSARFPSAADLGAALRAAERGDTSALQAILAVTPAVGAGPAATGPAPTASVASPTTTAPWGQAGATSPWGAAASAPPERTQTMVSLPGAAPGAAPWTTPPPPVYTSPRWPVLLLGLISLLCILGLVPLGMMAYRQVRLPTTPPRPVPGQSQLSPLVVPTERLVALGVVYIPAPAAGSDRAEHVASASMRYVRVRASRPPTDLPVDRADESCANI